MFNLSLSNSTFLIAPDNKPFTLKIYNEWLIVQNFSGACIYTLGVLLISDTSPEDNVGGQMRIVLVAQTAGIATGSAAGEFLLHYYGYKAPFIFAWSSTNIDFALRALLMEKRNYLSYWFFEEDSKKTLSLTEGSPIIQGLSSDINTKERKVDATNCHIALLRAKQLLTLHHQNLAVIIRALLCYHYQQQKITTENIYRLLCHPHIVAILVVAFAHGIAATYKKPIAPFYWIPLLILFAIAALYKSNCNLLLKLLIIFTKAIDYFYKSK
ncbi:hypothetical protein BDC45DRAFT_536061 [Circinella umbellata]|nr:hypothetical protein BDC45DRAFT_536061 [Circinella umbellata]